ncbi:hypothetical protein HK101_006804 [Irineochytrium annulatum]|nr:hypothetical protein HK101_006804 [Irineochytrium annulatum]
MACASQALAGAAWHVATIFTGPLSWNGWGKAYRSLGSLSFRSLSPDEEARVLTMDAGRARARLGEVERERDEINRKLEEFRKKEGMDFGTRGEWEKDYTKCFGVDSAEYTYEICFHDKAVQKNKKGAGSTDLGKFTRFGPRSDPNHPDKYRYLMFENGAHCWNGPARSVEVELECGVENKILSIVEPNKCEYAAKATSPIVCEDEKGGAAGGGGDETAHEEL